MRWHSELLGWMAQVTVGHAPRFMPRIKPRNRLPAKTIAARFRAAISFGAMSFQAHGSVA